MTIILDNRTQDTPQNTLLKECRGKRPRHCKIIGTLGPSSSDEETLRELIKSGLNIVRLNFSHGEHETHAKNIELVRRICKETGYQVGILQDLQGPKIRCGKLLDGKMNVVGGAEYKLEYGEVQTDKKIIPVDYPDLVGDVKVGARVLMDDGLLIFSVIRMEGDSVVVKAVENGELKNRKGVNFPDSKLSIPALTDKDSKDLLFGISQGVDFVALSFVQSADDVRKVKGIIHALGADVPVIAKIEKMPAIEHIDEIAQVSDALMVARGDLGVEAGVERVPGFQKKIVAAAAKYARPVVVATQMLESMIQNPQASLAEIADVANGVLDSADCLMLSGEVAAGKYPVESVQKMVSIIEQVESWTMKISDKVAAQKMINRQSEWKEDEAIARAACEAAESLKARLIVCLTLTGNIARTIAQWRPSSTIVAISPRADVVQRLVLTWGVYGISNEMFYNTDEILQDVPNLLKKLGVVNSGEIIVMTAGIPINNMCPTNMIKINRIP
jgi:pyruvate kinase